MKEGQKKAVLVGISSRFIHSTLASYCLKEYCREFDIEVLELNVNMPYEQIKQEVSNIKAEFIGFSCYIFNINVVKRLLGDIYGKIPSKIILGGPEASYDFEELLPLCDFLVVGEGEQAFKDILQGKVTQKVTEGGKPDLKNMPSPYTDYLVENVVKKSFNNKILYFESSRGCPYRCSYCMSSLSGGVRFFPLDMVKERLAYLYSCRPKQIKFTDRTFNADLGRAKQIIQYIIDMTKGDVSTNFHFEMSAEIVDEELIAVMGKAPKGLIQIEIGVQSFSKEALAACDRANDIQKLCINLQKFMTLKNVHIHLDLIAGLPYEDFVSFRRSVNQILEFSPDYLQIGFLKLLKGSKMRAECATHEICFNQTPPYEIISSRFISREELDKIRTVAAAVGTFYNKHRFDDFLQNMTEKYEDAFEMYYQIGLLLTSGKYKKGEPKDMHRLLLDLT